MKGVISLAHFSSFSQGCNKASLTKLLRWTKKYLRGEGETDKQVLPCVKRFGQGRAFLEDVATTTTTNIGGDCMILTYGTKVLSMKECRAKQSKQQWKSVRASYLVASSAGNTMMMMMDKNTVRLYRVSSSL